MTKAALWLPVAKFLTSGCIEQQLDVNGCSSQSRSQYRAYKHHSCVHIVNIVMQDMGQGQAEERSPIISQLSFDENGPIHHRFT